MTFILAVLAVFFVWEAVLMISPWSIPASLQPLLCYGAALGYSWPDWRLALAVCGAVTILHILIIQRELTAKATQVIRRSRTTNVPNLP